MAKRYAFVLTGEYNGFAVGKPVRTAQIEIEGNPEDGKSQISCKGDCGRYNAASLFNGTSEHQLVVQDRAVDRIFNEGPRMPTIGQANSYLKKRDRAVVELNWNVSNAVLQLEDAIDYAVNMYRECYYAEYSWNSLAFGSGNFNPPDLLPIKTPASL